MMREEVIPILHTKNAAAAVAWYGRLGFVEEWVHRFEPDFPAFVSIARGDLRIFLSEHAGDARPNTLIYLRVADLDALAAAAGAIPEMMPWDVREFALVDPDGNRLRIAQVR